MHGETIKINLKEFVLKGVDWINLAYTKGQWSKFVSMLINLRVPCKERDLISAILPSY
jgi:hypothetical protein